MAPAHDWRQRLNRSIPSAFQKTMKPQWRTLLQRAVGPCTRVSTRALSGSNRAYPCRAETPSAMVSGFLLNP